MELSSKLPFPFFVFFVLFAIMACAQGSPRDYVNAPNAARSQVGVPNIVWGDTVAAYARNYANQRKADYQLVHSRGRYSENIAGSTGDLMGTDAVTLWGVPALYSGGMEEFIRVGCAKVSCNNGGTFIGCNYDPPGNYVGQRPY